MKVANPAGRRDGTSNSVAPNDSHVSCHGVTASTMTVKETNRAFRRAKQAQEKSTRVA